MNIRHILTMAALSAGAFGACDYANVAHASPRPTVTANSDCDAMQVTATNTATGKSIVVALDAGPDRTLAPRASTTWGGLTHGTHTVAWRYIGVAKSGTETVTHRRPPDCTSTSTTIVTTSIVPPLSSVSPPPPGVTVPTTTPTAPGPPASSGGQPPTTKRLPSVGWESSPVFWLAVVILVGGVTFLIVSRRGRRT